MYCDCIHSDVQYDLDLTRLRKPAFLGLDVGYECLELLYLTRNVTNPKNPVLDVLNFPPEILDDDTPPEAVDSMLLYSDSEQNCIDGVDTLRSTRSPSSASTKCGLQFS